MTAAKKNTPPALDLPPRPPSKVEQGLKGETETKATETDTTIVGKLNAERTELTADEKRERAIEALVAAGKSREFAEAVFVLTEDDAEVTPADVADAVGEAEQHAKDFGAPLCPYGCHGPSWADVPAERDAVGCGHGSFSRKP